MGELVAVKVGTPSVALERVRKKLIPKELHCTRGAKECARD
jgi:hypothetical protein